MESDILDILLLSEGQNASGHLAVRAMHGAVRPACGERLRGA
jgi:hypothetical protein